MNKKIIIGLLIISLAFSIFSLIERYLSEKDNYEVEIVVDYNSLYSLADNIKQDPLDLLKVFKEKQVSSVAVYEDNLLNLFEFQKIYIDKLNSLKVLSLFNEKNFSLPIDNISKEGVFVLVTDQTLRERFKSYLTLWQKEIDIEVVKNPNSLLIIFPNWSEKYFQLSLGFDQELIAKIKASNLRVIPRLGNNLIDNNLDYAILNQLNPPYIIFAGNKITAYPDNLNQTISKMKEKDISLGKVEPFLLRQEGALQLAHALNYDLYRVHSIQQEEMDKYAKERIINRYLRAVRERNVRVLFHRVILEKENNNNLLELNLELLRQLQAGLTREGFILGQAQVFIPYANSFFILLIVSIGIIIASLYLLKYFLDYNILKWTWLLISITILVQIFLFYLGQEIIIRNILALTSAIVFPSLAIISQILANSKDKLLITVAKLITITLLGSVFLTASLSHIAFSLQVEQFRGVKLAFILPLLIISLYYLKQHNTAKKTNNYKAVFSFLDINLKVKHLVYLCFLIFAGILYIGRTGNFPLLKVPAWEIYLREFLENILYIRPRFKEFLFAHPFLLLALTLKDRFNYSIFYYLLVILTSIGQITIINSFSHIHTPLLVSIVRTFHGLWLGLGIGLILLLIVEYFLKRVDKRVRVYEE